MTLLDAKPVKPKTGFFKYIHLWLLILIIVVVAGVVTYSLWDYPEEHAVTRFLTTLEKGEYAKAYKIWKPAPSYQFGEFMHDWGPVGDYGKVRSFQIVGATAFGPSTVKVWVRVNHEEPPLALLVDRRSKAIGYGLNE